MRNSINHIINYLRRSRQDIERERRTGEDTLATQKRIMSRVLDDLNIPYDQAEEIGSGDKIETRPVFRQVLKDLEQGKYNAIAVKEIPRLGRGTYSDMGQIYDLLVSRRIYIITPYKLYDPQNPADARQIRFELFFAREEFEMIKERLESAKFNLAHEGKWICGPPPFGYRLNEKTTRLEENEDEARVVRLIFTIYVYGLEINGRKKDVSFRAIASYLTRMGVPTPGGAKSWSYMTVKRTIENAAYAGTLRYRTRKRVGNRYSNRPESEWIVVENAHGPLIDRETWDLAREKLKGSRPRPHIKLDFSPCELAGLVVCAKCGRRMVRQCSVQGYTKKNGEKSTYRKEFLWCPTPGCTCVKYRDVESSIVSYLETLRAFNTERLREVFERARDRRKETSAALDTAGVAERRRADLKRRLNFICEKYETGVYDDGIFRERKHEIEKDLALLDQTAGADPAPPCTDDRGHSLKGNVTTFLDAYREADGKTVKNSLLSGLITVIYLNKTGKGKFDLEIHPRFSFNRTGR